MVKLTQSIVAALLVLGATVCMAQDAASEAGTETLLADPAAPPPLPPKVKDEDIEPQIHITTEDDKVIEEYSYNGRIYLVKVTPDHGVPFYYMDVDGDGQLELQKQDDALNPVQPILWKVKQW